MYVLLKFVHSQFVEKTLDGNIHFTRGDHFINLEKQQLDKGIGDRFEGSWSRPFDTRTHNIDIYMGSEYTEPFRLKNSSGIFRKTHNKLKDVPLCSFVLLSLEDDFYIDESQKALFIKPDLEKKIVDQFKGRYLIAIRDFDEFIRRIDNNCQENNLSFVRSKVKYFDNKRELHPLSEEEVDNKPWRALFYKNIYFSFQKEFRILLKNPKKEDVDLEIGDIRDITLDYGQIKNRFPLKFYYKRN